MVEKEFAVPVLNELYRRASAEVLSRSRLPIDTKEEPQNLTRIHELAEQNYSFVFITNHWGMMEMPSVIEYIYLNPDLRKIPLLVPYASHQYKEFHAKIGDKLSTELNPTRTKDSDNFYRENPHVHKPENYEQLNNEFIRNAANNYAAKGRGILIAPEGGRRPKIEPTEDEDIVGGLLARLVRNHVDLDRVAFVTIATGLEGAEGEEDYIKWGEVKWYKKHPRVQVFLGNVYTYEETGLPTDIRGIRTEAKSWAFNELAKIAPQSTLPKRE